MGKEGEREGQYSNVVNGVINWSINVGDFVRAPASTIDRDKDSKEIVCICVCVFGSAPVIWEVPHLNNIKKQNKEHFSDQTFYI